jgi:hypothetical protein
MRPEPVGIELLIRTRVVSVPNPADIFNSTRVSSIVLRLVHPASTIDVSVPGWQVRRAAFLQPVLDRAQDAFSANGDDRAA